MPSIVLLAGAEKDTFDLFARLESRDAGASDAFYFALDAALQQLSQFAESSPIFQGRFRRKLLAGYPLGIFYVVEGNRLFVHAILDLRQSPESIRRRLAG